MGNDDSRKLILARRARFVAAALASVAATTGIAVGTEACGGESEQTGDAGTTDGGRPQPCLRTAPEAGPQPCLEPPVDNDAGPDAQPQPCLFAPVDDAG